jgi:hypothetical protein
MNKEKMLQLADCMEKVDPSNFNMSTWSNGTAQFEEITHGCGTTCCIAGWQQVFRGRTVIGEDTFEKGYFKGRTSRLAADDLELTEGEKELLFFRGEGWPRNENGGIIFPNTPKGAADRIRCMVETGR